MCLKDSVKFINSYVFNAKNCIVWWVCPCKIRCMNPYGTLRPAHNSSECLCIAKDNKIDKCEQTTILLHLHLDWMTSLLAEAWWAISCLIHPAGRIGEKPQLRQNNRWSSIRKGKYCPAAPPAPVYVTLRVPPPESSASTWQLTESAFYKKI